MLPGDCNASISLFVIVSAKTFIVSELSVCINLKQNKLDASIYSGNMLVLQPYLCKNFKMISKKASESLVVMTELVLPNDTNLFGNLMGGRLMYWMDIAAALAGTKHCNAPVVTASVDNISFTNPIKLGNVVHIEAKLTRSFNTSMEVHLNVWGEDVIQQYRYKSNEAYYTFVALDPNSKPRAVPKLEPETEEELALFESALRRRQLRLILGGKMKPMDAVELKALFNQA